MKTEKNKVGNFCRRVFMIGKRFYSTSAIFIFLLGFCSLTSAQEQRAEIDLPKTNGNYRIGAGDVLRVMVVKQTLLSVDGVRVGNDGTIRLPMLDESVKAACLTEAELSGVISERYKKYLMNPQIYVAVKEFNANPVALVGAVVAPGRFQLQRPMRLLELLTLVNGPAANAGKTVQIIRSSDGNRCGQATPDTADGTAESNVESKQEIISLPLAEVLKGNDSVNPFIQAGDVISVAEAELLQAFVVGNVKAATTINLKQPVTLSKAIAMAGGVAAGANVEKVKISRQQPDSLSKTELFVNLKNIGNRSQDDILLQPNDIVDVPGANGTRKFLKDIFRTAIPVITRVPVIIP